jgi:hypothetical protein
MKHFFCILLLKILAISFCFGQTTYYKDTIYQQLATKRTHVKALGYLTADSIFRIPKDTLSLAPLGSIGYKNGQYYAKYTYWQVLGSTDTTSLSNRINLKVNIADTAAMLAPYLRKADTTSLSNRINLKVNISDTATMLTPYVASATEGLTKSGKDIRLGAQIGSQAAFSAERNINTNRYIMHWTNGIAAETGGAYWQFTQRPYSPFQFISNDTVPGNDALPSMARPLSGIYARRTVHFPSGTYKTQQSYGHYFGQTYSWQDTMVSRNDGMDYQQAMTVEQRYKPRNSGYQVIRLANGTGNDARLLHATGTLVSNTYYDPVDNASTDTLRARGYSAGITSYLVAATGSAKIRGTGHVYFLAGSLQNANSYFEKTYVLARQTNELYTDTAWLAWDTLTKSKSHFQNLVLGKGDSTQSGAQFKVYGASLFNGWSGYWANVAANYTSRSFTDKNYVDSAIAANLGIVDGIDDVLAVAQPLTAPRTIDLNGNPLELYSGVTQLGRQSIGDGFLYGYNGSNVNGYIYNSTGTGGLFQIESVYNGGAKYAGVRVSTSSASGKILMDGDSIVANAVGPTVIDTTNYKPVVIGPGNVLHESYWYGSGGGGGGTPALTQYRLAVGDASNLLSTGAAITGSRALVSDANGVPTHAITSTTQVNYLSTTTSDVQTQINTKLASSALSLTKGFMTDTLTVSGVTTIIPRYWWYDEFQGSNSNLAGTAYMFELVSGTAANASVAANAASITGATGYGYAEINTGTTTTGKAVLSGGYGATNQNQMGKIDNDYYYRCEFKNVIVNDLSDGTEAYKLFLGFQIDNVATNNVYFTYTHSENSGVWNCTSHNAATPETTSTGTTVAADTEYDLAIEIYNQTVKFYINGSLVATNTTHVPAATSTIYGPSAKILKSAGTTAKVVYLDAVGLRITHENDL